MPAFAVRPDPRDERLQAVHGAAEVHAENPIPVVVARRANVVEQIDPGIVAEDVHLAEHLLGLIRRPRHGGAIRDIEPKRMHLPAAEGLHRLIEMVLADIGDDDVHTGRTERLGHAKADAAPATGDEGRHACNVSHGFLRSPPCRDATLSPPGPTSRTARGRVFVSRTLALASADGRL